MSKNNKYDSSIIHTDAEHYTHSYARIEIPVRLLGIFDQLALRGATSLTFKLSLSKTMECVRPGHAIINSSNWYLTIRMNYPEGRFPRTYKAHYPEGFNNITGQRLASIITGEIPKLIDPIEKAEIVDDSICMTEKEQWALEHSAGSWLTSCHEILMGLYKKPNP